MRFVGYGAGAVGGVVGALLHRVGHEVVLIARGEHLAAIQARGLTVLWPGGSTIEQIPAVGHPRQVDWRGDEVVLLGVKSDATLAAAVELAEAAPPSIAVVSLQNSVANEPTLLRFFEDVYGVCVMAPTGHLEPGVVEAHCHPTPAILDIGRYPDGVDSACRSIAAALEDAGIVSEARCDIMRWKHRKLVMNLGNAVQAVCGSRDGVDELRDLIRSEAAVALDAAGIEPISEAEDADRRGDILRVGEISERPRTGGSSWQSLERRTGSIESDYLNGEIVWLGRRYGTATPANELIRREATRLAAQRCGPGTVDPRGLLARLGH